MTHRTIDPTREAVREHYGTVARTGAGCCAPGCCAPAQGASLQLGYSAEDLSSVPAGADLGLGCGNPQAIAALQPGETVLDLGSGGGFDCFLAAKQVGPDGRVIGVAMTPEMITKAPSPTTTGPARVTSSPRAKPPSPPPSPRRVRTALRSSSPWRSARSSRCSRPPTGRLSR